MRCFPKCNLGVVLVVLVVVRAGKGCKCSFFHRVPTLADCGRLEMDMMHDVFGRERHATQRDDMGGVGCFNDSSRTLFVGGLRREPARSCIAALQHSNTNRHSHCPPSDHALLRFNNSNTNRHSPSDHALLRFNSCETLTRNNELYRLKFEHAPHFQNENQLKTYPRKSIVVKSVFNAWSYRRAIRQEP